MSAERRTVHPNRTKHLRRGAAIAIGLKRLAVAIAALYGIYLALILLVVNPLLNELPARLYQQQTGRSLHFEELLFNPFALKLRARGLADQGPAGDSIWAVQRLDVDASLRSLWHRAWVFDEITMTGLRGDVTQTGPNHWNVEQLIPASSPAAPEGPTASAEPTALPPVLIERFTLGIERFSVRAPYLGEPLAIHLRDIGLASRALTTAGGAAGARHASWAALTADAVGLSIDRIELESLRASDPFSTYIDELDLYLDHLSLAGSEGQPFALALTDESGGRLYWHGSVSLDDATTQGTVAVHNVGLRPLWQYLRPKLNFKIASGEADLSGSYMLDWSGDALRYRVTDGALAVTELELSSAPALDSRVAARRVAVRGIAVDGATQQVRVAEVAVTEPAIHGWSDAERISLVDMFAGPAKEEEAEEPASWQIAVTSTRLVDGRVDWRATQLPEPLELRGLDASARAIAWPATAPVELTLETGLNGGAQLAVTGQVHPGTLDGRLDGSLEALPLTLANTALAQVAHLAIAEGTLSGSLELRLDSGELAFVSSGGAIADLEVVRTDRDRRLLAWRRLQWVDVDVHPGQRRVTIDEIDLADPWLRFQINADGTTNVSKLMIDADAASAQSTTAAPKEAEQIADADRAAGVSEADPSGQTPPATAENGATPEQNGAGEKHPQKPADTPEQQQAQEPAWQIALASLHIDDGRLLFADRSLPYPFRVRIQQFTGDVVGLSSDAERPAEVELAGRLANYAPVTLSGRAAPLADPAQLDLALTFSDVDMALLTPYVKTYAGYAIDSGLLTVELAYKLEDERIRGSNRVVARQLTLGEQVASPKAVDLPIRLALALLTDSAGVIDLNVNVTGDLGDPQFGIGDIVRRAFFNAIKKVALSPFRFLGGLIGADAAVAESLDQLDFAPGATRLAADQTSKIASLRKALELRPSLRLHVVGHVDQAADKLALRQEELRERLLASGLDEAAIDERADAWREAVANLYRSTFPEQAAEAPAAAAQVSALLDTIRVSSNRLRALAMRRAQSVKQALAAGDGGLSASRIYLDANPQRVDAIDAARATLRLEG